MSTSRAVTKSRVGRKPVSIPAGAQVSIQNRVVHVKGAKGSMSHALHPFVSCEINDKQQIIFFNSDADGSVKLHISNLDRKTYRSIVGTTRVIVANMIKGVTEEFTKKLNLLGVGYRAQLKGKQVGLSLGYSHETNYTLPEGVKAKIPTQTEVILEGSDKFLVGKAADEIRAFRPPEPYKGKGVRHENEQVIIKEVKKK